MIDLNEYSKKSYEVAEIRYRNGAFGSKQNSVQNLLKHCAGEIVEATEAYCPYETLKEYTSGGTDFEGMEEPDLAEKVFLEDKERFSSELADIIVCVFIIAGRERIDIEKALLDCYAKNLARANGTGDKK
ncbi:MAG: hypothetical protein J5747_00675 [Spirochaetaceae bacterium]|nr:hypothetical protein [Spirochaetaceae bacterium]